MINGENGDGVVLLMPEEQLELFRLRLAEHGVSDDGFSDCLDFSKPIKVVLAKRPGASNEKPRIT